MSARRHRVVQWATGNIGLRSLREVIRHPALELVGVLVYDPAKDGVDAGVLCGEEPVGVRRHDRCATPCTPWLPTACCTCRAPSISTTSSGSSSRARTSSRRGASSSATDTPSATRDAPACSRRARGGNIVVYATGSSPGFISETLPFALLSMQRRVESITDRRVRRTCRDATRRTCCSSRWASASRSTRSTPRRASYLLGRVRTVARRAGRGGGPARRRVDGHR